MQRSLSVIIPALNEERYLGSCLHSVAQLNSVARLDAEVIVVDGGSTDRTREIARRHGARLITTARGRGRQLRAGADAAGGDVLFFLHADSRFSSNLPGVLSLALADPGFQLGTFRLRLDSPYPLYRLYSWFTRFDSLWTSFGDQGIVVLREFYQELGGFPSWPLLEDVELLRHARHRTAIRSLPAEIITSPRRFVRNGIIRQQISNGWILLRYLLGRSPEELAASYLAEPASNSSPRRNSIPDVAGMPVDEITVR